jgi:Tfp pilus assembly protein FimT
VLISTILAIAAPSLRGFVHGRQAADAAAQILALTHLARSQAAAGGCVHRLNFDIEEGTYWLTAQRGGAFVEIDSGLGRTYRLPVGVSVKLEEESAEEESPAYIQFYPDGRCDSTTIELTGADGEVLQITCPSATERFRVLTESEVERR